MREDAPLTQSRWLRFALTGTAGRTLIYSVQSVQSSGVLGKVSWFGRWRGYAFYPEAGAVFDAECLRDIASACETLTRNHTLTLKARPAVSTT